VLSVGHSTIMNSPRWNNRSDLEIAYPALQKQQEPT
jgi:hypothetical protein